MNNIKVLTVDFSTAASNSDAPMNNNSQPAIWDVRYFIQLLISASKKEGKAQIKKIVLKRRDGLAIN